MSGVVLWLVQVVVVATALMLLGVTSLGANAVAGVMVGLLNWRVTGRATNGARR